MSGKVGRPLGHRLSEASKRAISISKTGQRHSQETKDKISASLIRYFKCINPLSKELEYTYKRFGEETTSWIRSVKNDVDSADDIITERIIKNSNRIAISCGNDIEFFSHGMTPEIILMVKEFCEENNLTMDEFIDHLECVYGEL